MAAFTRGNPGGPGGPRIGAGRKPSYTTTAAGRLFGNVKEADLKVVLNKAIEQAKDGDAVARAWLFDRIFGRVVASDVMTIQDELRQEFDDLKGALLEVLDEAGPTVRGAVLARVRERAKVNA